MGQHLPSEDDSKSQPVGADSIPDWVIAPGFLVIVGLFLALETPSIVLLTTFLIAFFAYILRYIPSISSDGPRNIVFVGYFLAMGLIITV